MGLWPFGKKRESSGTSLEVEQIFRKVANFLNDEAAQNAKMPAEVRKLISSNEACDYIKSGSGEFGRTPTNPIPVNGPLGEVLYLSTICTMSRSPVTFHRLGSVAQVDAYELLSMDGRQWDVLYLSLYYPRKSCGVPRGYRFDDNKTKTIRGTNERLGDFPRGVYQAAFECANRLVGFPAVDVVLKAISMIKLEARSNSHLTIV